jgi:hypothetical protein
MGRGGTIALPARLDVHLDGHGYRATAKKTRCALR